MPTLASVVDEDKAVKMLVVGESGTGKTGALASLAKAGYNLKIADFENGLDPLIAELRDDPDALARVSFMQFFDKIKKGRVVAKAADAFTKAKLTSAETQCHVIVLAHLMPEKAEEGGTIKWYPQGVTENQSRTISRAFNTVVMMKQTGHGHKVKRVVVTTPQPRFACKCPWKGVPEEIPIEEGYLPIIRKGEKK